MASTFTPNKHIEKPAAGDFTNAWATPVNADWDAIDNAFGGHTVISVTGVGAGTYTLTLAQYQVAIIEFTGTLTANLKYQLPASVGGLWAIVNGTTGAFSLTFAAFGGGGLVLPQSANSFMGCDGTSLFQAQTLITAFSQLSGQVSAAQVPVGAVTQYNSSLAIAMSQVSGALPAGQLPATAYRGTLGSGNVTVQSGGAPAGGASGDIFLIY
jgi:hypothetical protein